MSPYGFLDLFPGKVPAWIKTAEKHLRKNFGKPCKDYAVGCVNCQAWIAWGTLWELTVKHTDQKKK